MTTNTPPEFAALDPDVKREAVLQLRALITAIEDDEVVSVAWCATPKNASLIVGMMNGINPWTLGGVHMLASGIEHAMLPAMRLLEMKPMAVVRPSKSKKDKGLRIVRPKDPPSRKLPRKK